MSYGHQQEHIEYRGWVLTFTRDLQKKYRGDVELGRKLFQTAKKVVDRALSKKSEMRGTIHHSKELITVTIYGDVKASMPEVFPGLYAKFKDDLDGVIRVVEGVKDEKTHAIRRTCFTLRNKDVAEVLLDAAPKEAVSGSRTAPAPAAREARVLRLGSGAAGAGAGAGAGSAGPV